jgi:hypothetical protein
MKNPGFSPVGGGAPVGDAGICGGPPLGGGGGARAGSRSGRTPEQRGGIEVCLLVFSPLSRVLSFLLVGGWTAQRRQRTGFEIYNGGRLQLQQVAASSSSSVFLLNFLVAVRCLGGRRMGGMASTGGGGRFWQGLHDLSFSFEKL